LSAIIGSTLVALLAETQQAISATTNNKTQTAINVTGSLALMSYSNFVINRVKANDEINPAAKPARIAYITPPSSTRPSA
jgi:hypothetical protein